MNEPMLKQQLQKNIADLYGVLPIATALFERDDDGVWSQLWSNATACSVLGSIVLTKSPLFKLELMDARSQIASTTFLFDIPNQIERYRFIATPYDELMLVQFVVDNQTVPGLVKDESKKDVYPLIIEAGDFGIFDWDIQADFIHFNQRAYQVLGVHAIDLGNSYDQMLSRIHVKDKEAVVDAVDGHLESRWPLDIEFRVLDNNQLSQWVHMTGQAEWHDNQAMRLAGTLSDVSERKHAELQLKQNEVLIEQMIDALPMSVYVKDATGSYRFFNREAERLSGKLRNQVIGLTDIEVYPSQFAQDQIKIDESIQQSEKNAFLEKEFEFEEKRIWMYQGKVPMHVKQLNHTYETWLLSFSLDISKRKAMEEEIKEARITAEQAAKAKADFLSVMSHEIRTPLNSVIGNSGLLLSENLDEHLAKHIEMIKRSGEHLLYLINDILDFNKLEAGKVELENKSFNLEQQIKTVIEMSATNAKLKSIDLHYEVGTALRSHYLGDEGRLRQVLLNLVGNAIKFTSKGGVNVKVLPLSPLGIRFEVIDTGIGISQENIPKLFSEFSQADASTTRKFGGTGLGLSISKKLVEAMGGQVGITSIEGEGSTFWFEIPYAVAEESAKLSSPNGAVEEVANLSILVAEDNLPNQFLIKTILTKFGHSVTIANNGLEAFRLVQDSSQVFDLILMDMQMPEMDGLEATQQIRMLENEISNIPIIALTANTHEGDFDAVMAAGMNDYLSKPVNIMALKEALQKWGR